MTDTISTYWSMFDIKKKQGKKSTKARNMHRWSVNFFFARHDIII